ncbi:hypothetical protein K0T92_09020 [Paenibacillus oenotherae]|uniref:Uncharacterized protein n=1 Tax=Paenibacillus oenotherae TaxID=1435645 RepID=A0ABS7D4P0_9BACL|nr:hypothetical protein [Paenibacillus oenotherae]MBW7474884.1 hypothetical protein [Paenibacillus oenotherae]
MSEGRPICERNHALGIAGGFDSERRHRVQPGDSAENEVIPQCVLLSAHIAEVGGCPGDVQCNRSVVEWASDPMNRSSNGKRKSVRGNGSRSSLGKRFEEQFGETVRVTVRQMIWYEERFEEWSKEWSKERFEERSEEPFRGRS